MMDNGAIFRRVLFLILLVGLVFLHLIALFKGLSEPTAMDQAQIGRETARGNFLDTKFIRPIALYQGQSAKEGNLSESGLHDTYHAPLNPIILSAVLKAVGADDFEAFQMGENQTVYTLDRVVAGVSTVAFIIGVALSYILAVRVFDAKIGGVTALLMILSSVFWEFSLSGLPQMVMLIFFTGGLLAIYRGLELQEGNRSGLGHLIVGSVLFGLLALTHWLAVWLVVGLAVFAALAFRPRGVGALVVSGVLLAMVGFFLFVNYQWTANPTGTAGLTLFGGLTGDPSAMMRTLDPSTDSNIVFFLLKSLLLNTITNALTQVNQLYMNLGAIAAAPIFFLALLHPFKRKIIGQFRWLILLMFIASIFGVAVFGTSDRVLDPNQIQILFAPIMTAYGLAMISILWSRLKFQHEGTLIRHGHFLIVVLISSGPMMLSIPKKMIQGLRAQGQGIEWPYYPLIKNRLLSGETEGTDVIVSDQPWAVAWYADRLSVWVPRKLEEFEAIEELATENGLRVSGIYLTPTSFEENPLYGGSSFAAREELAPLMLDGPSLMMAPEGFRGTRFLSRELSDINTRYPRTVPFFAGRLTYYTVPEIN